MNPSKFSCCPTRGSALITVMIIIFMMAMLSASIIGYSLFERRMNERNRLALRSENVAENISLYAAEQMTAKLQRMGAAVVGHFPWTGTSSRVIHMPPASATYSDNVLLSEFNSASAVATMEVRAGIEARTDYATVNDITDPNNGLQIATARVPIIAKGSATHPTLGTTTTYVEQDMQLTLTPLFQFGMFYNMDLEFYPSGDFTLTGPAHTNNSFLAHPDVDSTKTMLFMDRVTAAEYIFAYQATKCDTRGGNGTIRTPGDRTKGFVKFTNASNPTSKLDMKSGSGAGFASSYDGLSTNLWADCRWGDISRNLTTAQPTATQLTKFKNWATNTYNGNLRAGIHGVTKLVLPGIGTYKEVNDPSTPEDDRSNGRQIIEPPNPRRYKAGAFTETTDTADQKINKISWRAGLFIMVNPSDIRRNGKLPNGNTVHVLPRSYRCWLSTPSGTAYSCTEVVLPGQPTYGQDAGPDTVLNTDDDFMYRNYLPNRLMLGTSVGSNQVLRTSQQTYGTVSSGYTLPSGGNTNDTALTVSAGTGPILAGDVVTIGTGATAHRYLVASDLDGTTLHLASPGLRVTASSGATVTVNAPVDTLGTAAGFLINKPSGGPYAIGTTAVPTNALAIKGGGTSPATTILPGNTFTIGTYKYLVTAATVATPHTTVWIASPGLRAAVADNTSVLLDRATSRTLGTGTDYALNGAHSTGLTTLSINTGVGTLLPGNSLLIGSDLATAKRYLVTSVPTGTTATTALTSVTITPGLAADAATGARVIVDPYAYSGYATSGNGGGGWNGVANPLYPEDSTANAYAAEAYFYDMRRANNNGANGTANDSSAFLRSTTASYTPRPIAKIDLDMGRLNMMVDRVVSAALISNGYKLNLPDTSGAGWGNFIFNKDGTMTDFGLGIYHGATTSYSNAASFPDTSTAPTRQNPFGLYRAPTSAAQRQEALDTPSLYDVSNTTLTNAWHDGVAVYINSVDAEVRAQTTPGFADRIDSGVRLWNGRGPVASRTVAPKTGCTIATNDALYIIGHYNADGTINPTATSTGSGTYGYGGYSAKYPDSSAEYLCSVYGDAITILSQPGYTQGGSSGSYTYAQTSGWNDAFSALAHNTGTNATWRTSAAGSIDGVHSATAFKPGALPNVNRPGTEGTARNTKFAAVPTEVSTALVIGIVPSNHNPTGLSDRPPNSGANNVNSGGANNFPRFLEQWDDTNALYIRGSMVALFESRVAMEPFTHSRCYNRPGRFWGLHHLFSLANHDVPLEPVVHSADRLGFRQLTAAQYAARKAQIESWPVIP